MTRLLLTMGIPFLLVALIVSFLSPIAILAFVAVFLVCLSFSFFIKKKTIKKIFIIVVLSGLISLINSFFYMSRNTLTESDMAGQSGVFIATIEEIEIKTPSVASYILKLDRKENPRYSKNTTATVVYDYDQTFKIGDKISFAGSSKAPEKTVNFDFYTYYKNQGIDLRISIYDDFKLIENKPSPISAIKNFRFKLISSLNSSMGEDAALLKAILLGDRSGIPPSLQNVINHVGISHVFVVSGLHITLISMLIITLLSRLRLNKFIQIAIGVTAVWFLVIITGFGVPAVRSGIMLTLMLLAELFTRKADRFNSLFGAGIIIAFINPLSISTASFLLSFLATLGILLMATPTKDYILTKTKIKNKFLTYIIEIVTVTISSNLATFIPILIFYNGISLVAPFTNIATLFLLPFIIICGILMLLLPIPQIVLLISSILRLTLALLLKVFELLSKIPFSYIGLNYKHVYLVVISIALLSFLGFLLYKFSNKSYFKLTAVCSILVVVFANVTYLVATDRQVTIATIIADTAQSLVVSTKGSAVVVSFGDDKYIDIEVLNYLQSINVNSIEGYIFDDETEKSRDLTDTKSLFSIIKAKNVYVSDRDTRIDFLPKALPVQNDLHILKNKGGYLLIDDKGIEMSIEKNNDGRLFSLQVLDTKIIATDNIDLISDEQQDILFLFTSFNKKLEKLKLDYVILTKEPPVKKNFENVIYLDGFNKNTQVTINKNGKYKIE